ncbi:conserved hypothetical protein [Beggiatoa sp. PS]|nr:conserved hypothetical protein [Beggiatoa sp. PS]
MIGYDLTARLPTIIELGWWASWRIEMCPNLNIGPPAYPPYKNLEEFSNKDIYLFLGTTRQYHSWANYPFVIIGVFYPPIKTQGSLF